MMKKVLNFLAIVASASVLVLVIAVVANQANKETSLGSVGQGNEYKVTSTFFGAVAGEYTIKEGVGTLGSIVIVSTTPANGFTLYDADSVTSTPTTTIAIFPASAAAGTYTLDVNLFQGLRIIVPSGFTGQFVTTYR